MLLFFVLGLLSKPMVVTFPFVLLLLDLLAARDGWTAGDIRRERFGRLVYEKIPLFALSAAAAPCHLHGPEGRASAVASLSRHAPRGAFDPWFRFPMQRYLENGLLALDPARFLPLSRSSWPAVEGRSSAAAVPAETLTIWTAFRRKRCRYLLIGWLWYLGTLVP
ncbi:MAG: hypothetical protein MZV49_25745 [Rhodopseudomonas palustris]|nr:hypothetical protein [Rhodopseudomonas palustris]